MENRPKYLWSVEMKGNDMAKQQAKLSDWQKRYISDSSAAGVMVRRVDNDSAARPATSVGEADPVLAVIFGAGLTNTERNDVMRSIALVPGVCIVQTMQLHDEIVALERSYTK